MPSFKSQDQLAPLRSRRQAPADHWEAICLCRADCWQKTLMYRKLLLGG
jgi:hypothetical protein